MSNQTLLLRISALVGTADCQPFRDLIQSVPPNQLSDALSQFTPSAHLSLLDQLSSRDCADSFSRLLPARQLSLFEAMTAERRVSLMRSMSPQQRVSFVWGGSMLLAHRQTFARDVALALAELPVGTYVDLSSGLPPTVQAQIHRHLPDAFQVRALHVMSSMRATHLQLALDETVRREAGSPLPTCVDGAALGRGDEGTVGAIMKQAFATVAYDASIADALAQARTLKNPDDAAYGLIVIDEHRRLMGLIALQDLLHASPTSNIADITTTATAYVRASWPEEATLRLFQAHRALAAPVLDDDDRVVGILPVDTAMDIIEDEVTEDFHKGGGTLALHDVSLRTASTGLLYRKRVFWLVLLVFGNLFSGAGLEYYGDMLQAYIVLVFFLPLLIDSGGNAGAQAATLMVRALATGDVVLRDWINILVREFRVAGLLGLTMAVAVCSIAWWRGGPDIALVVALSMVAIVVLGSIVGMCLPFLLSRFKLDPASASAPLVTSLVDALGVLIYLGIAVSFLGAPAESVAALMP